MPSTASAWLRAVGSSAVASSADRLLHPFIPLTCLRERGDASDVSVRSPAAEI